MRFISILAVFAVKAWAIKITDLFDIEFQPDQPLTCAGYSSKFDTAFEDSTTLIDQALEDIRIFDRGKSADHIPQVKRDAIAAAVAMTMGIKAKDKQKHVEQVEGVFDRMSSGIRGSLPRGHEGYRKPAIACGDKGWKLYKPDDEDPNDASEPKRKLRETRPGMSERGAWHWRQRWIKVGELGTTEESVNFCGPPGSGVSGLTLLSDLIIFCDRVLNSNGYPKPAAQVKQRLVSGVLANKVSWDLRLTSTMIHEFSHYFGSVWDEKEKEYTLSIIDVPAVDAKGETLPGNEGSYRMEHIMNLAKAGPDKATLNADSYTYFAIMTYLDNYQWTKTGRSKAPTGS
ncbi:hypothetical protein E8E14_002105 [Neopestalotiopsis sp. 37M]|nr:hypothetical protein E8E14_002105 [Neopestalotiopsis sp. 37M]